MLSKHIVNAAVKPGRQISVLLLLLCMGMALLSGCETTPVVSEVNSDQTDETPGSAEDLLGRARLAAPEQAADLYLQAAWAFLAEHQPAAAAAAFDALEPAWLAQQQLADFHMLAANVALWRGDPESARAAMNQLPASYSQSPRMASLEARLCASRGDFNCALTQLVRAAGDSTEHNELIWFYLDQAASASAEAIEQSHSERIPLSHSERIPLSHSERIQLESASLNGWRSLHHAFISSFSHRDARPQVRAWSAANPDHPAAIEPPAALAQLMTFEPSAFHIGLMLPLTGPLRNAGQAVRDGFIAASLLDGGAAEFTLSIYDTTAEPIPAIYERALAADVDLIIGPLQKNAATMLNSLNPDLPVLMLNYLDDGAEAASNLMQFGLAIEDEASTIADRIDADGINKAIVFHNYEDWSLRARTALMAQSQAELTAQSFTDLRTVTEAVGTAMHVADSQTRKDALSKALGVELEFLPRARGDVDAIIALVDNIEANTLVPALRFHFANDLPVYASSQVVRRSRSNRLSDLVGFHVSELPWFLAEDDIYAAMRTPLALDSNPFASLVALGSDAYRIADRSRFSAGKPFVLSGSTGLLRFNDDRLIHRQLAWGLITATSIAADPGSSR